MNNLLDSLTQWAQLDPSRCKVSGKLNGGATFFTLRVGNVLQSITLFPNVFSESVKVEVHSTILLAVFDACKVPTLRLRLETDGAKCLAVLRQVEPEVVKFGMNEEPSLAALEALLGMLEMFEREASIIKEVNP